MITEKKIVDKIEVVENNFIQIREANIIEKDGIVIAKTFHRFVLTKGDDLTNQDEKVKAVANAVWSLTTGSNSDNI